MEKVNIKICSSETGKDAMSKIKILMITVRADYGGGPEHLYQLVTHLPDDVEIYIAAPEDKPYYDKYLAITGKEKIITIPHRKFTFQELFRLIRYLRANKIDMIHSHGKGAGIYSRIISILTGIPVIHTFHGIHVGNNPGIFARLYILLERFFALFTLKIIAVSKSEFDKAVKLKIASSPKLVIIENGVVIPGKGISPEVSLNPPYNILTITRFDNAKNTELLLPVIDSLKDSGEMNNFHFIIIGQGGTEKQFRDEIEKLGYQDYITFAGTTDNAPGFYIKSFCYISTSRWEGLPLAVMEAMSFGLPVVATDVTGNRDLVEHGLTGFLYPLDNPDRAAKIIAELARNKELWLKVSEESSTKIKERYSVNRMAEETMKLYLSLQ